MLKKSSSRIVLLGGSSVSKELSMLDKKGMISEKLSSMSQAIFLGKWSEFHRMHQELMDFRPTPEFINNFGREEMKSAASRAASIDDVTALRENLTIIGVSDEAMDTGYDEGFYVGRAIFPVVPAKKAPFLNKGQQMIAFGWLN
jgi:hypothetical protein